MLSAKEISILYIAVVVPLTETIPLSIAINKYVGFSTPLKIMTWYLVLGIVFCGITSSLALLHINNMPVMHIYTMIEGTCLSLAYYRLLQQNKLFKVLIPIVSTLFLLCCIVNIIFFQHIMSYNSYSKSLEAIMVVGLSMSYFTSSLHPDYEHSAGNRTLMYLNAGILLYFAASLVLFIILNIDPRFIRAHILIWDIHATFLLVMFTLFSIGLWRYKA